MLYCSALGGSALFSWKVERLLVLSGSVLNGERVLEGKKEEKVAPSFLGLWVSEKDQCHCPAKVSLGLLRWYL